MIFTELTRKALQISFDAHKEQLDKSGMLYVCHPYRVAEQMSDEYSTCVALLHDVVEDTAITLEDISAEGFPSEIVEAIKIMTHNKDVPYFDYIKQISKNSLAKEVKLADLRDNSNYDRLAKVELKDLQRNEKYREAIHMLSE